MPKTANKDEYKARLIRWMDDLDAIREELIAEDKPELNVLAEHLDSVAADLEFQHESIDGRLPIVVFR